MNSRISIHEDPVRGSWHVLDYNLSEIGIGHSGRSAIDNAMHNVHPDAAEPVLIAGEPKERPLKAD